MRALGVLAVAALLVVLAAGWIRWRYVVVTVHGDSMAPGLAPGDRVLIRRGRAGVRRGSVVVLKQPDAVNGWRLSGPVGGAWGPSHSQWYIKRVVATAGELFPEGVGRSGRVPDGHVAVLGDNPVSIDSRVHGPCPAHQILGVMTRPVSGGAGE